MTFKKYLLCTMKTCSESLLLMLNLICVALPVLEAQRIKVLPEVTGYLGEDVTLPCNFTQGQTLNSITHVQWNVLSSDRYRTTLIVFNSAYGLVIHESPLKGRLEIEGESLIIKSVEKTDAGSYVCIISAFPSGSYEGTTKLIVQERALTLTEKKEQMVILPKMIAAGVFLLVVVAMLATTHVIIIRMRRFGHATYLRATDTGGPVVCD
ncbi:nectin-4-like [Mugil cephalus]|uniref:nectin-4-like n=1 Tax=Mugil cephalus TaxID=48193 RepID=UPI001FB625C5|nr:nectin-4-like [Mugil cephalus]